MVTPEEAIAILTAVTALVTALGVMARQIVELRGELRRQHDLVNGRLGELLTTAQLAALREGELRGRDYRPPLTDPQ